MKKRLAISLPLIMELWYIQLLVITEIVDDVELCCLQLWSYNVSYYYSIDDFWCFWTAFYPIMEATVITCFLRQYFQWSWTIPGFTHIVCVSFADGFIGLLLYKYIIFSVLAYLYYTFYLLKPGMNQQIYMNLLMNYIYRASVLECSYDN